MLIQINVEKWKISLSLYLKQEKYDESFIDLDMLILFEWHWYQDI